MGNSYLPQIRSMTSSPDDNYWIDKIDDPFAGGLTGTLWGLGTRFVGTSFDYFRDRKQVTVAAKSYADKYRKLFNISMQRGSYQSNRYSLEKNRIENVVTC